VGDLKEGELYRKKGFIAIPSEGKIFSALGGEKMCAREKG